MIDQLKKIEMMPIWRAENSLGSMAILEIGKPQLEVRKEFRNKKNSKMKGSINDWRVFAVGEYSLHIWDSNWKVLSGNVYIGGSTSQKSVQKGLKFIEGRFIKKVGIKQRTLMLSIEFEHNIVLSIKPFDHLDYTWTLAKNTGKRWSLGYNENGEIEKESSKETIAVIAKSRSISLNGIPKKVKR
jgi:hypothetical protein